MAIRWKRAVSVFQELSDTVYLSLGCLGHYMEFSCIGSCYFIFVGARWAKSKTKTYHLIQDSNHLIDIYVCHLVHFE